MIISQRRNYYDIMILILEYSSNKNHCLPINIEDGEIEDINYIEINLNYYIYVDPVHFDIVQIDVDMLTTEYFLKNFYNYEMPYDMFMSHKKSISFEDDQYYMRDKKNILDMIDNYRKHREYFIQYVIPMIHQV